MKTLRIIIWLSILSGLLFVAYLRYDTPPIGSSDLTIKKYDTFINPKNYSKRYRANELGQSRHLFESGQETRRYNAYIPTNLTQGKHPAIFLFHGAGRNGAAMVERWKENADKNGLILIAPDGIRGVWGQGTDTKTLIPSITNHAIQNYPIDPNKLFLFGHSAGANFVNWVTTQHADLFVASGLHGGGLRARNIPTPNTNQNKIPIIYILGTKDSVFPVWQIQKSANTMLEHGHKTELVLLKKHNHWYYDLAPQINNIAIEFFNRQSEEALPNAIH